MFSKVKELITVFRTKIQPPETDKQRITKWVMKNICPDCGGKGFYEGPSGGISQNILCGNADCGSRFNFMGELGVERISDPSPNADSAHAKAQNLANHP